MKNITVITENETLKLTIKGNVIPTKNKLRSRIGKLKIKTRNIALGKVFKDEIITDTLNIQNTYERPIKINFDYDSTYIKIISEPEILEPKERGKIITNYDTSKKDEYGHLTKNNKIIISSLDDSFIFEDKINILLKIEEDFSKLTAKEMKKSPRISFSDTKKEIKINQENIVDRVSFEFKNKGKTKLFIRSINATKGCIVGNYDKMLDPGKSGKIEILLDQELFSRPFFRNITVISNDPENSLLFLKINGKP